LVDLVRHTRTQQREIARKAGISEKHLSQMLNGHAEGTLTVWQAVLDAAGLTIPNGAKIDAVEAGAYEAGWNDAKEDGRI
jgi:DNA-binding phage protein